MIDTNWFGRAVPGAWYGDYHHDWHAAHPGAWERGEQVPGSFYRGNRWGSSTLSWDERWFRAHGAKMPAGAHSVVAHRDTMPLRKKMNPTDTGIMRFQFRED